MLDHLRCRCGHYKALHGGPNDTECRICWRIAQSSTVGYPFCARFRWRWLGAAR